MFQKLLLLCLLLPSFTVYELQAQQVKISGLSNIELGVWNGSSQGVYAEGSLCIYNQNSDNYTITARGSGLADEFTLLGPLDSSIDYELEFKGAELTKNTAKNFSPANRVSDTCGGLDNATYKVSVSAANLGAAKAGSYTGTLTLILETAL